MGKIKKIIIISLIAILVIAISEIFVTARIENRTWLLSSAQQAEAPYFIVAHNAEYDFSNDKSGLYEFSEPIELICEAKNGKLILTDKTNEKTYEGTYTRHYFIGRSARKFLKVPSYSITIDGVEGTANISSRRTLFVSIGGYYLNFEID